MNKNHYNCVYMYTNKINGKRYIGQAKNFIKRHNQHIRDAKANRDNYHFHKAIRKYGIENFEIKILKENLKTQCVMDFWEYYYIEKLDTFSKNNKGYNVADGGHGGSKLRGKTDDEIKKIYEKRKETMSKREYHYEHIVTDETKYKISQTMKARYSENHWMEGRKLTEETKKKLSALRQGSDNPSAKAVVQIDYKGNIINVFSFMREAQNKTGINSKNINACCRGRRNSAGKDKDGNKFHWKYLSDISDDDLKIYIIKNKYFSEGGIVKQESKNLSDL